MVTYDIACQYKKNWVKRRAELPEDLQPVDGPTLRFALPVWHGDIHQVPCKTENLLSYQTGGTKVDGECPERFWGAANLFSNATKEWDLGQDTTTWSARLIATIIRRT